MVSRSTKPILTVQLRYEHDVVTVRQRARRIAAMLGFELQDQTRIATAASEIARNAFKYAGGGTVEFRLEGPAPQQQFVIEVIDQGPGIAALQEILDGRYTSKTGMGLGIIGAKRLMDRFNIDSAAGKGTRVSLGKNLGTPATSETLQRVSEELARAPETPVEELQKQNQELLQTLEVLRQRESDLARVNRELEDTNRGVVALYSELDDRADYLQRSNELKTRFLSNMSHEFRTPLNTILSLMRIMLEGHDGELNPEHRRQASFVRKAAQDLSELVNDLLDLARVEAGKIVVRPHEFDVRDLFGALRGMLRPLLSGNASVDLIFDDPVNLPLLNSDEGKISQVLRNFISNALKFTERGEIRVSATIRDGDTVVFSVADSGIGIARDDQERIFQEWIQVDNPVQKKVKGTGLGLPLSRKLTQLLGGSVWVESELGKGSTFYAAIPIVYAGPAEVSYVPELPKEVDPGKLPVLVVEDNRETLFIYEKYLRPTRFQPIAARTVREARRFLQQRQPVAIMLDILLEGESTWTLLGELKSNPKTKDIPILVITVVDNQRKAISLGADFFCEKPCDRGWLLDTLDQIVGADRSPKILIIDDEEASRYVLKSALQRQPLTLIEADGGRAGIDLAVRERPTAIFLDFVMPEMNGLEVLKELRNDPRTKDIPVIISSGKPLDGKERSYFVEHASALLPKQDLSPEKVYSVLQSVGVTGLSMGVHGGR